MITPGARPAPLAPCVFIRTPTILVRPTHKLLENLQGKVFILSRMRSGNIDFFFGLFYNHIYEDYDDDIHKNIDLNFKHRQCDGFC